MHPSGESDASTASMFPEKVEVRVPELGGRRTVIVNGKRRYSRCSEADSHKSHRMVGFQEMPARSARESASAMFTTSTEQGKIGT